MRTCLSGPCANTEGGKECEPSLALETSEETKRSDVCTLLEHCKKVEKKGVRLVSHWSVDLFVWPSCKHGKALKSVNLVWPFKRRRQKRVTLVSHWSRPSLRLALVTHLPKHVFSFVPQVGAVTTLTRMPPQHSLDTMIAWQSRGPGSVAVTSPVWLHLRHRVGLL